MSEEGGLLQISMEGLIGWVAVPTQPGELVTVVLSVNDEPLATGVADRFDLDPVRRQIGLGVPGFAIRLTRPPSGYPPFTITARSSLGLLLGEPLIVQSLEELAPAIAGYRSATLEGMVDQLVSGRIQGWVWDRARPEQVIVVDIWDGKILLGRAKGDQMREDLRKAGVRGGWCSFSFELPLSLLDMQPHAIRILVSGTSLELPNSPIEFGPTHSPLVQDLARLRQDVEDLTNRVGSLLVADGAHQREVMRVLAERLDAYAAIQQETIERRLDAALCAEVAPQAPVFDLPSVTRISRRKS